MSEENKTQGEKMDALIQYNITDTAIQQMSEEFLPLTISGIDDKEGYEKVHKARMITQKKRVEVEKKRRELKADALEYGRKVDREAKRIFGLLAPIEDHLKAQEKAVDDEKAKIKEAAAKAKAERTQKRVESLHAVKASFFLAEIENLSDEDFEKVLQEATEVYEAEEKRLAEEKQKQEEEKERLEKQRLEQEAKEKEQAEREAKLKAEEERIEKEKQEAIARETRRRQGALIALGFTWNVVNHKWIFESTVGSIVYMEDQIQEISKSEFDELHKVAADKIQELVEKEKVEQQKENERIRKEAEEKAKRELEEKVEKEKQDKLKAEKKAKAKAERLERLKPDKQKLLDFADALEAIPFPKLKSPEALQEKENILESVKCVADGIRNACQEMGNQTTLI